MYFNVYFGITKKEWFAISTIETAISSCILAFSIYAVYQRIVILIKGVASGKIEINSELTKEQCDLTKGYLKTEHLTNSDDSELVRVYILYTQKQLYLKEIDELRYWFENEYKEMFEKCTRKIVLGKTLRDGTDPHTQLNELYAKAEANADRINELTSLLKNC